MFRSLPCPRSGRTLCGIADGLIPFMLYLRASAGRRAAGPQPCPTFSSRAACSGGSHESATSIRRSLCADRTFPVLPTPGVVAAQTARAVHAAASPSAPRSMPSGAWPVADCHSRPGRFFGGPLPPPRALDLSGCRKSRPCRPHHDHLPACAGEPSLATNCSPDPDRAVRAAALEHPGADVAGVAAVRPSSRWRRHARTPRPAPALDRGVTSEDAHHARRRRYSVKRVAGTPPLHSAGPAMRHAPDDSVRRPRSGRLTPRASPSADQTCRPGARPPAPSPRRRRRPCRRAGSGSPRRRFAERGPAHARSPVASPIQKASRTPTKP